MCAVCLRFLSVAFIFNSFFNENERGVTHQKPHNKYDNVYTRILYILYNIYIYIRNITKLTKLYEVSCYHYIVATTLLTLLT